MSVLSALFIFVGLAAALLVRNQRISWLGEFLIITGTVLLFWELNVYLALCILIFHSFGLMQLLSAKNLLGTKIVVSSMKQKLQAGLLVAALAFALGIEVFKKGLPADAPLTPISNQDVSNLFDGEILPYVVILCLLSSVMMLALVAERRKR